MSYLTFKIIAFIVCLKCSDSGRIKRIVGGMPVLCGEQPRVASLRDSSSSQHLCGATIISPQFAVTAAHCANREPQQYFLQLTNYCTENETYPVAEVLDIITHHSYNKYTRAHDISILQITLNLEDAPWLNHRVLPVSSFGLSGECVIYGNGYKAPNSKEISEKLQAATVKIVSLDECTSLLGPYVAPEGDSGMLCALGDGVDACQGDSGGALICNSRLEGISSYGLSCGVAGLPGVYTSIGAHLTWIHDVIRAQTLNKTLN